MYHLALAVGAQERPRCFYERYFDALRRVLDWCLSQDLETMPASRYVADVGRLERPAPQAAERHA